MNRSNAASALESTERMFPKGAELLFPQGAFTAPSPRRAIIFVWRPAPGLHAAAVERVLSFRYRLLKRAVDIIGSLLLLIVLLPLGMALALLVALSSRGPAFYCEERVGRFGVPFRIVKFRSMYTSQAMPKVLAIDKGRRFGLRASRFKKTCHDPRITPVGRILRRLSLDELPQLWNVLAGDMSLVGPRPIIQAERRLYGCHAPYYDLFRPGITGLWQISGRSEVDYDKRVSFDAEYASRWSCRFDLLILARTIPAVVTMRGAY